MRNLNRPLYKEAIYIIWKYSVQQFLKEEVGKIVDDDECRRRRLRHQAMPVAYGPSASKLKTRPTVPMGHLSPDTKLL